MADPSPSSTSTTNRNRAIARHGAAAPLIGALLRVSSTAAARPTPDGNRNDTSAENVSEVERVCGTALSASRIRPSSPASWVPMRPMSVANRIVPSEP